MATAVGPMEEFGGGGAALLPRTRQLLSAVWEQLCLLLHVIYYTFMSVFQMFRFEVHVRITDDTGEHIQHMAAAAAAANPSESFLSFCTDVGDPFSGRTPAKALLSSLVDEGDGGLFLGPPSGWNVGFSGDWNVFVSSSDCSTSSDTCHRKVLSPDPPEEDRSSPWSADDDPVEFDSEESKALWESLSRSSDPYNPFFFSGCISTSTKRGKGHGDATDGAGEELRALSGVDVWVSRSDSESSWSSCSGSEVEGEDSDGLLELLRGPQDPYHPMCFTACTASSRPDPPAGSARPPSDTEETEESDEEQLWRSLCRSDDPYHPLNFRALLHSGGGQQQDEQTQGPQNTRPTPPSRKLRPHAPPPKPQNTRPTPPSRKLRPHAPPPKPQNTRPTPPSRKLRRHADQTLVPWKRPSQTPPPQEVKEGTRGSDQKQVRFSPRVQVHVMRTWPFARQTARRGPWEEMARDRDRFQRRVRDAERAVGRCLGAAHRARMRAYVDAAATGL